LSGPEKRVLDLIIDTLRADLERGRVAWFARVNSGASRRGKGWVANYRLYLHGSGPSGKGIPDIIGQMAGGQFFAVEAKAPGEKASPEQDAFIGAVRMGGGKALVASCLPDAARNIEGGQKTPQGLSQGVLWYPHGAEEPTR
jgi:hypothetical protein